MYTFEKRDKIARALAESLCTALNLEIISENLFNESMTVGTKNENVSIPSFVIRYHEYNTSVDGTYFQMLPHRTEIRSTIYSGSLKTKELLEGYISDKLFALETVYDLRDIKPFLSAVDIELLYKLFNER